MTIGDKMQIVADGRVGEVVNTTMLRDLGGVTLLVYCEITHRMQPEWHLAGELRNPIDLNTTLTEDLESILENMK